MVLYTCLIPLFQGDRTRVVQVYYPLQIVIIDWLLMFVNQTVGADLLGVLHPRPVFGLFLHFSQKLQHIGNK